MDDENSLPTGGGGLFGSTAIAESMAFMGSNASEVKESLTPVDAPAAEAAPVEVEAPVAEAAVEPAEPVVEEAPKEVLPPRGGPSPVLREYMKAQEERVRRSEAAVEALQQQNAKLLEALERVLPGKVAAKEAEPEPEDEPLDPLERDVKSMRAKLESLEKAQADREARMEQARYERTLKAARDEIASEVESVVKEFPELAEFRNEVYANVAYNSEVARQPGSKEKELPVAEIARQFARRLGLVKAAGKSAAAPAKTVAPQVKSQAPGSAAPVPRHPAASASVPSAPKDVTKLSFQDLSNAWVSGR